MRIAAQARARAALVVTFLCSAATSWAGPSEYVYSPIVEEGEREIDFKAGNAKSRDGSRDSASSLGIGWGGTSWWFTEVYAKWHKPPGQAQGFDAFEWENRFQLTETGKYAVDVGLLLEIERPKDRSEGYEYRWGPLLQSDLSPNLQANLNLLLEKRIRGAQNTEAELGYQWQLKHRWRAEMEFGMQGFGNVGPWTHWQPRKEQPHTAGPALFGKLKVGERQTFKYNAGLLFGLTDAAPRTTIRLQGEFEF